tara:strand:+ start:3444 stop:3956 length:513 start_codon:yes stop_codon:yes gene_type:complete
MTSKQTKTKPQGEGLQYDDWGSPTQENNTDRDPNDDWGPHVTHKWYQCDNWDSHIKENLTVLVPEIHEDVDKENATDATKDANFISHMKDRIAEINGDFEIVERIEDGCDEGGILYWVECKNGWHDRSWNLSSAIKNSIEEFKMYIYRYGFLYDSVLYYYTKKSLDEVFA